MKLRKHDIDISESQEREAVEAIKKLASSGAGEKAPPAHYFANLIVRTNEKIDHVTSGKALSISWLARVAVPGVVAILFFFIGLHYYKADAVRTTTIAEVIRVMSPDDVDSLYLNAASDMALASSIVRPDLFDVSTEQMADFYVTSGSTAALLESLPESQLTEVAAILESQSTGL